MQDNIRKLTKMKNEVTKRDPLENFEAQFKKATLPLMILSILSEREMYAYEIVQVVLELSQGKYKMPLLYNILTKLKENGFIEESEKIITDDNRIRIYYAITGEGKEYLEKLKALYKELTDVVRDIVYKGE